MLRPFKWLITAVVLFSLTLFLLSPFFIYNRLNQELPVAELYFQKLAKQRFLVFIATGNLCHFKKYVVAGDQWQLDARFLKWNSWFEMLGIPSLYSMQRLSGRYRTTLEEMKLPRTSYDIAAQSYFDWFAAGQESETFWMGIRYGASVYMDLDESKTYRVYKTEDGLIAKTLPHQPLRGEDGLLMLTIDRSCGKGDGFLQQFVALIHEKALRYL